MSGYMIVICIMLVMFAMLAIVLVGGAETDHSQPVDPEKDPAIGFAEIYDSNRAGERTTLLLEPERTVEVESQIVALSETEDEIDVAESGDDPLITGNIEEIEATEPIEVSPTVADRAVEQELETSGRVDHVFEAVPELSDVGETVETRPNPTEPSTDPVQIVDHVTPPEDAPAAKQTWKPEQADEI